jgi:iron complex outermembrane recepter protein
VHSRSQSLLLCLSLISTLGAVSVGEQVASAQPTPTDSPPPETPAENPPANPPSATDTPAAPVPTETGTISGTIRSPDLEAPLSGATVTIEGTNITATTDETGRFQLAAPPGRVTLRADFSGFRSVQKQVTIAAGKTADIDVPMSLDQLLTEVVVVVGSRTPRTNVETPVPVDVVTAEDISHVGKSQTGRVLSTLAPSYVSTPQTVADGTDHVDPASLRGLGPDQVLVLVNGKRRHKSSLLNVNGTFGRGTVGTDLNAIPVGSIKRIEILRDGAASQYGSDAIAGVINVVTKDYTDLFEVTTSTGVTGRGDGAQIKTSANYGFKIGKKGFLNLTGEFLKKEATNRSGTYNGNIFTSPNAAAAMNNRFYNQADPAPAGGTPPVDDMILAGMNLTRDDFKMKIGEAASEDALGGYNMEIPIDDASTFYSFGDIGHRSGQAAGFFRFPNQFTQNVSIHHPLGFLPEIHSNINDAAIAVGVRRKGEWTIDASLTHGRNSFQFNIENSVNASLGPLSPTTFNAGTLSSSSTIGDLDLLRKIDTTAVKSLALVLGTEVRTENYKITAGDPASYENGFPGGPPPVAENGGKPVPGAQVFPGFQPGNEVDRNRNNVGVYAGFESEIIKGLNLDVGGRYENYSDFGNSFIGKAATRIPVGKAFALRAAGSTGFRAPSLQQLWFNNISTRFINNSVTNQLEPVQVLTSNNESPITKAFGIPPLKEERSTHVSAGVTLRPLDNLSLTADAYLVRIKDRIVLTSTFPGGPAANGGNPIVDQILAPFPGVGSAQFFANAIDTETRGIDVVADYAVDTGTGTVMLSAAANFTRTLVDQLNMPGSLVDRFGEANRAALETFFFGRLSTSQIEDSVPRQKGFLSARYNFQGLSALARANYYGRTRYQADLTVNDEIFGAKVLFDVDLGYQVTKNLHFSVGADNLLNTFPDKQTKASNISNNRFVYSRAVSQFGQNGGFYYGKLELTFF